ncbi:type II toxin-antitoxin system VapC family toxin [Aeoliella mucimassa]|uniref:PIN domain protein n=1 Tax=Aeoliella mucimassa TaxID=2527972 RepID=A0A518AKB3_9BACT|nr:type II toxin-antitoxin system VapC family toxin [Aeoliella mucimassa]QDU55155.1 PIN domain protein [Aeoliella mucimassa]
MRILLDTHALLWYAADSPKLSGAARSLIESDENEKCLSIASCWEIAIKVSLGKLTLPTSIEKFFSVPLASSKWSLLSPGIDEMVIVSELPFHHRDPFDRLLVAQAISESLPLVSNDSLLDQYSIDRKW